MSPYILPASDDEEKVMTGGYWACGGLRGSADRVARCRLHGPAHDEMSLVIVIHEAANQPDAIPLQPSS
jgi:hypothetical protein